MITWNEHKAGKRWDAYAGPVHIEVYLTRHRGKHYWSSQANDCWLEDQLTFDAAKEAALRYALAELDSIIEQCQDAKREIEEMGL